MLITRGLALRLACRDLKASDPESGAIRHTLVASRRVPGGGSGHTQWSGLLALIADAADSGDAIHDFVRSAPPMFSTLPAIETDGGLTVPERGLSGLRVKTNLRT